MHQNLAVILQQFDYSKKSFAVLVPDLSQDYDYVAKDYYDDYLNVDVNKAADANSTTLDVNLDSSDLKNGRAEVIKTSNGVDKTFNDSNPFNATGIKEVEPHYSDYDYFDYIIRESRANGENISTVGETGFSSNVSDAAVDYSMTDYLEPGAAAAAVNVTSNKPETLIASNNNNNSNSSNNTITNTTSKSNQDKAELEDYDYSEYLKTKENVPAFDLTLVTDDNDVTQNNDETGEENVNIDPAEADWTDTDDDLFTAGTNS